MDLDLGWGVMELDFWCPACRALRIWFRPDVPRAPRCVLCGGLLERVTAEVVRQFEDYRTDSAARRLEARVRGSR